MNINVEGFKPYPAQKDWIEKIEDPAIKYACLVVGRQVGKSLLATNLILKWALENNGVVCMYAAPLYSQVRKIFDDIHKVVASTPLLVSSNKSNYEMVLLNGSKILFRSTENADSLRGYTLNYLIVDEAAFVKNNVWDEILKPTILVKGKKCLFVSTPKNKGGFLHRLYLNGLNPEKNEYISMNGSSYMNPHISKEDLDEAKKTMPEEIFRSEILGEFTDGGGSVFKNIENYCVLNNFYPKENGKKYYAGIDVGRQDDYSVLTIIDDEGKVVFIYRQNNAPWDTILGNISKYLNEYQASAFMEVNGIGDALYEQLEKNYKNIHPFITTNQSKQQIIEDLIYELNIDELKLPSKDFFPALYNELDTFTYHYSPQTRKVQYKAIDGAHDDCVMSLAIALYSIKQKKTKGSYYIY
jgi:phage FluMu gp28-like protein